MEEQPVDEDELWSSLEKALRGAFEPFVESRVREGENLKKRPLRKSSIIWYHMLISLRSVRHRLLSNTVRVLRKAKRAAGRQSA